MKNYDQAEQGYMRLAEDTLEGMSEEELQEALQGLEEWDTHFNTSKHYAPRFGPKIQSENSSFVKLALLISGILIVIYCLTILF
ncbi:MAG: hypothetical protein CME29_05855 [Gemmatimonadetes bacterium]|nr:hypothetical protein [Gemmatimonadota bacterium]|tara:strand:+ start:672 stop:923 length:252 start_codon:yes stop_codon:yes gene_type:complete